MELLIKYKNIPFRCTDVNKKSFILTDNDTIISNELKKGNEWEPYMLEYFQKYIKHNSTVIDIGSNIGTHTINIAKMFPDTIIHAFEPLDLHYDILNQNIKINNLSNVTTYKKGLSNKKGVMYEPNINFCKPDNFGGFGLQEQKSNKPVDIITLDSLSIENISFIKCDVEGHELNVLEGAIETIEKNKPTLIVEVWQQNHKFFFNSNLYKKLKSMNYKDKQISNMHGVCDYIFTINT